MSKQPPPSSRDERKKRLGLPSVPLLAGRNNIFTTYSSTLTMQLSCCLSIIKSHSFTGLCEFCHRDVTIRQFCCWLAVKVWENKHSVWKKLNKPKVLHTWRMKGELSEVLRFINSFQHNSKFTTIVRLAWKLSELIQFTNILSENCARSTRLIA